MSWLNLNDSFNNLKGQITTFANNVLADDSPDGEKSDDINELQRLCSAQQEEIARLKKLNEELLSANNSITGQLANDDSNNWSWDLNKDDTNQSKAQVINNTTSDLEQKIVELENEKKELMKNLELLDADFQENTEKLVNLKDTLQKKYDKLEEKYEKLKDEKGGECKKCNDSIKIQNDLQQQIDTFKNEINLLNSNNETLTKILEDTKIANNNEIEEYQKKLKLIESENKILIGEVNKLQESITRYEKQREVDAENFKKLASILEGYETKVTTLKNELELCKCNKTKTESDDDKNDNEEIQTLKIQIEQLQNQLKNSIEDTCLEYSRILENTIMKLQNFDLNLLDTTNNNTKFNQQINDIIKLFTELKINCDKLEKDIYNITQEKTNLLTEKNHEIEKLLHNSEILSQEVITKSQTIKDYEHEINELIKNNDILINELDEYKNSTTGLQTISETNEDNLLMLETQLDNANKKIEQLEHIIKQHENRVVEETNDDVIEELRQENRTLTREIDNLQEKLEELKEENAELLKLNDKNKIDLENTEYQYTEVCVNVDSLKDEIDAGKNKIEQLNDFIKTLEKSKFELERTNEEYRSELNIIREKLLNEEDIKKDLENQCRIITEKLQSSKMNETSHKLQLDTINKKLTTIVDSKCMLEKDYQLLNNELDNYKLKVKELESELDITKQLYSKQLELQKQEQQTVYDHIPQKPFELPTTDKDFSAVSSIQYLDKQQQTHQNDENFKEQLENIQKEKDILQEKFEKLLEIQNEHNECSNIITTLQNQLQEIQSQKDELTNHILLKHQENVTYHNEIQRLSQLLKTEMEKSQNFQKSLEEIKQQQSTTLNDELEKLQDQNNFLKEKCDILTKNLLEEQSKVEQLNNGTSEKETILTKKLERLQAHLIELEEHYTQELLKAEEKNIELQNKVTEIEEREKNSSTMYTSVNIRANQHVETLQTQLQMITNQRDDLRKKISDMEDYANKQAAALANLQFVLDQFQKEKENDVKRETERIRKQIDVERQVQENLRGEIRNLKLQLDESKQGLLAASRLSDQLEQSRQQVSSFKTEVLQLKEKLTKAEEQLKALNSNTDGKVDKSLIKNLIIGFITSNNNLNKDQTQILKIIATVLDFNQQDNDKLHLNKNQHGQNSWLSSLLTTPHSSTSQGMTQESLSQAFVKFLEAESKPRVIPSLLNNNEDDVEDGDESGGGSVATTSSGDKTTTAVAIGNKSRKSSTTKQSSIILSEVVLPTFADFAQNRNSSSILKDVLKDGS